MFYQDNYFAVCDNEFTECFVSLQAFMKTLKSNILEAYKVQVDCFKIQSLIFMIKMI